MFKKKIDVLLYCAMMLLLTSCPNKVEQGQGPKPEPEIQKDPYLDEEYFIGITPPESGIVGQDSDLAFPEEDDYWKGVFVKDRIVKLSPFKIAKYEVTYELWKKVYDWAIQNDYKFSGEGRKGGSFQDEYVEANHSDNEPVTNVNWRDCVVWCNAYTVFKTGSEENCIYTYQNKPIKDATYEDIFMVLESNMNKKGYRLPTEAEWEFVARYQGQDSTNAVDLGGFFYTRLDSASGAKKPIGFKELKYEGVSPTNKKLWEELRDESSRVAVYRKYFDGENYVEVSPKIEGTKPVGSKAPNYLGIYDMTGNVAEWLFDEYASPPQPGTEVDPVKAGLGGFDDLRTIRGASWAGSAYHMILGYRTGDTQGIKDDQLGFRLAYRP